MRNLVPCTFEAGTRTIHIPLHEMTGVENIRLIVNETQKVVICSSMQKDNITSCVKDNVNGGWDVTYKNDIPALASGDALTVEIDLGNHNYIDGTDWIAKAKANDVTDTPFVIGAELGAQLIGAANKSYGLSRYFYGIPNLLRADLSHIPYIRDNGLEECFKLCTMLEEVDLSGLVSFGSYALKTAFSGCSSLRYIDLSSLGKGYSMSWDAFTTTFSNTGLSSLRINPDALSKKNSDQYSLISTLTNLTDLIFSRDASTTLYIQWQPNLNFASVKNILEHCANANMSGKTITFYSGGLTVQDDAEGTLQTLYNSVVNTYQANIANLTITPYSA